MKTKSSKRAEPRECGHAYHGEAHGIPFIRRCNRPEGHAGEHGRKNARKPRPVRGVYITPPMSYNQMIHTNLWGDVFKVPNRSKVRTGYVEDFFVCRNALEALHMDPLEEIDFRLKFSTRPKVCNSSVPIRFVRLFPDTLRWTSDSRPECKPCHSMFPALERALKRAFRFKMYREVTLHLSLIQ